MQLLGEINSGKPLSKRYAHRDTPCFRVYVSPFLITVFSSTPILPNLIVDLFAIFTGVDSYNSKPSDFINILFASSRHRHNCPWLGEKGWIRRVKNWWSYARPSWWLSYGNVTQCSFWTCRVSVIVLRFQSLIFLTIIVGRLILWNNMIYQCSVGKKRRSMHEFSLPCGLYLARSRIQSTTSTRFGLWQPASGYDKLSWVVAVNCTCPN